MPLLLNALRNATGADSQQLRVKVLECAGFAGPSSMLLSNVVTY
jgi:hypothetical protein